MKLEAINSIQHAAWLHDPVTIQLLKELDTTREGNLNVAEVLARQGGDKEEIKDFVLRAAIISSVRLLITKPEINNNNETQEQ